MGKAIEYSVTRTSRCLKRFKVTTLPVDDLYNLKCPTGSIVLRRENSSLRKMGVVSLIPTRYNVGQSGINACSAHHRRIDITLLVQCRSSHPPSLRDLEVAPLGLDQVGVETPEEYILVSMLLDPLRNIAYSRTFRVRPYVAT